MLELKGKPFVLRDGAALSVAPSYEAAATLLAEELARFTGIVVTVTSEPPRKGDLWLGPPGAAPRGARFPSDPLPAEGFALSIDPGLAAVAADVRLWVKRSCSAQGVPPKVADSSVLAAVAGLLGVSDAPDRLEAARIEAVVSAASRIDDDVVEESGDDRALAAEIEHGPALP